MRVSALSFVMFTATLSIAACDGMLVEDDEPVAAPGAQEAAFSGGRFVVAAGGGGGGWGGSSGTYNCRSSAGSAESCESHADLWGDGEGWYWGGNRCYFNTPSIPDCTIGDGTSGDWDCDGSSGCQSN
ncbi:MAG: hypothetical protein IT385_14580 [Deltaproteobacteria bacterium]|nr:hypothetical protein [Deltaproteobacteria bacterium]